jgi:hydrogenase-4 component E
MGASGDLAHLLGGTMLVLSLVLLAQRRARSAIDIYAVQAWVLAAAAAWQGWTQDEWPLGIIALAILAGKGVLIPAILHRIARANEAPARTATAAGGLPAMVVGVGVVILAILAVRTTTLPTTTLAREDLASALSVVLLGLLAVAARRSALGQMLGFLAFENGCALAAVSMRGMPPPMILLAAMLLLLPAAGMFIIRARPAALP